ncbi:MAG: hypothetical protein Q9Q40_10465 [Acidobacteriota bacterium]|nr:hypothetical protein [Acidobacteriota bacterium]
MSAAASNSTSTPPAPACAVITPIGPGHEEMAVLARASVEAAFAEDPGIFASWRWIGIDDSQGRLGRSRARNRGVAEAAAGGAEWIFFLDADDLMDRQAFGHHAPYADTVDGLWGLISAFSAEQPAPRLREGQLGPTDDLLLIVVNDPFLTLQMGHFVRTRVALQHPFDETLDAGEDFDYYLRVWASSRCRKIDRPLFHNRRGTHAGGPKSPGAAQWRRSVRRLLARHARLLEITARVEHRGRHFTFHIDDPVAGFQQELIHGRLPRASELDKVLALLPPRPRILLVGGGELGPAAVFYQHFAHPLEPGWLVCPTEAIGDALGPAKPPFVRRRIGGPGPDILPGTKAWNLVHLDHPGHSLAWLESLRPVVDAQTLLYMEIAGSELAPFLDLCRQGLWRPLEVLRETHRQAMLFRPGTTSGGPDSG